MCVKLYECKINYKHKMSPINQIPQHHTTTDAVSVFCNDTLKSFNKNETTLGVFLDLSNAFDTIDHTILIDNLFDGIRGSKERFKSYLLNRNQYVEYNHISSQTRNVTCGVRQGLYLDHSSL